MSSLSKEEIHALGKVAGLEICEPELTEVYYNLNAIMKAMKDIDVPDLNTQEPLPIIIPQDSG
ncbi:MAG: hypothetical protein F4Y49_04130 [Dehalococcoidia bacterium]|nr:hypothetical protein [Dehalococcoidia bacterium]